MKLYTSCVLICLAKGGIDINNPYFRDYSIQCHSNWTHDRRYLYPKHSVLCPGGISPEQLFLQFYVLGIVGIVRNTIPSPQSHLTSPLGL